MTAAITQQGADRQGGRARHCRRLNADPVMRARISAGASAGMKRWWDGRRLPPMTPAQRWKYRTIREALGRDEALRQVLGS